MNDYKLVIDWPFIQTIIWTVFIAAALMAVYIIGGHDRQQYITYVYDVCKQVGFGNMQFDLNNSVINIRQGVNASVIAQTGSGWR